MENLNYHGRLKELQLCSLERRRERYRLMYAWKQIEGQNINILELKRLKYGKKQND